MNETQLEEAIYAAGLSLEQVGSDNAWFSTQEAGVFSLHLGDQVEDVTNLEEAVAVLTEYADELGVEFRRGAIVAFADDLGRALKQSGLGPDDDWDDAAWAAHDALVERCGLEHHMKWGGAMAVDQDLLGWYADGNGFLWKVFFDADDDDQLDYELEREQDDD